MSMTYEDVRGWLNTEEAEELASLARGRTVLEVGTFCGRSAIAMAATAKRVYCVDHFCGDRVVSGGVRDECFANFDAADVWDRVVILHGSQETVLPILDLKSIDMVFYDADHSYESTSEGICLLQQAGLREDATLVFHDYASVDRGVDQFVNQLAATISRKPRVVGTLAIFEGVPRPTTHTIMLAIPHNGTVSYGTAQAIFRASSVHDVRVQNNPSSLLAASFNWLLATALNCVERGEITHLAFLHADLAPQDGWIDILVSELERLDAALVSVVSPIKDARGLTSTGIGLPGASWNPKRRFTMTEIMDLPETFNAETAGYPGHALLVNSGCWVADLRHPAFHRIDNDELLAHFTINDRIVRVDGQWVCQVEPEDWFFSRRLHAMGASYYATRKVRVEHFGAYGFPNDHTWGGWAEDTQTKPFWGD